MQTFNMGQVPPITFGAGRLRKLPDLVNVLGGGPVLVIADAILAELGATEELTHHLSEKGVPVEIAAEVSGEPKEILVDALCEQARLVGAKAVVGIGGGAAMDAAKGGEAQLPAEKAGAVHAGVGKASFDADKLAENIKAFVGAVNKAKPSGAKGTYVKKIALSSTMGPGVTVDVAAATAD